MNLKYNHQLKLGRDLFQINFDALRQFTELQREYINHYFQLNRDFVDKLPNARNIRTLMEMQRDYNELVMNDVLDAIEDNSRLFRHAIRDSGIAVKDAFYADAANDEAAAAAEAFHERIRASMESQPLDPDIGAVNEDAKVSTLKI